jgi:hypothetical protein
MCETQAYVDFVNTTMGKDFQNWEEMFNDEFVNPKGIKFLYPEDVTEMVVWLGTSNEATKFNGREIVVDKGAML